MLSLSISDINKYVKARMDELSNNDDAQLVTGDQAVEDLEKIISAVAAQSVRKIHLEAPNILLKGGASFDTPTTTATPVGSGHYRHDVAAPSDLLRIVTMQMSDWVRPIQTLVGEDSVEYRKQGNIYLMGTPSKPVGALVHRNGNGVIELYTSLSDGATLQYARYIPEPTVTNNALTIVETLKQPCLDEITAEVLRSLGRHQEATVFEQLAVRPFMIDPDYARMNPIASERFNTTG